VCLIIMCVWFSAWVIRCMFVQVVVLAWMYACDRCVHKSALYTCTCIRVRICIVYVWGVCMSMCIYM